MNLAGDGFFVLVDLLEAAKAGLPKEVPSPLDDRFSDIAHAYRKAEAALRQQVREQILRESTGCRCSIPSFPPPLTCPQGPLYRLRTCQ